MPLPNVKSLLKMNRLFEKNAKEVRSCKPANSIKKLWLGGHPPEQTMMTLQGAICPNFSLNKLALTDMNNLNNSKAALLQMTKACSVNGSLLLADSQPFGFATTARDGALAAT